jgi:hypothetical protein
VSLGDLAPPTVFLIYHTSEVHASLFENKNVTDYEILAMPMFYMCIEEI